jgi:hypothetical protein
MRDLQSPELEHHFLEFSRSHPELSDKLAMWMASAATLEFEDPAAAALFEKEFPELKG